MTAEVVVPYAVAFFAPLAATLMLTPLVREANRRLGLVDRPGGRRINKTPIPRGGGVAVVAGVLVPYLAIHLLTGRPLLQGVSDHRAYALMAVSAGVAALGFLDDWRSLPPKAKLLGQVVAAFLAWAWVGLGFRALWPWLPAWADCVLTVLWIVGAVNAFNLIDGLDGLASGLALIAVVGMAGSLFYMQSPQATLAYFALAGGLVGFLRYNSHPASVFLGDSGSMFIGFSVSTLPLASQAPHSLLVSVGVPLLAMGVPAFDVALAVVRRTVRRAASRRTAVVDADADAAVMSADSDHLHHRILRRFGFDQRKAAWTLYAVAAAFVAVGLAATALESRSAGLWLVAFAALAVAVFKCSSIELFDAAGLLGSYAHAADRATRRRVAMLSVPFLVFFDVVALAASCLVCAWLLELPFDARLFRALVPMCVVSTFAFLVLFRAYRTVWARAFSSNYLRLAVACALGGVCGCGAFYYYYYYSPAPEAWDFRVAAMAFAYAVVSFAALLAARSFRELVRSLFYALDCSRLKGRKGVSRVLVYGAGLRYRAFRRELVRTTSANKRMIVGLLDDDVCLKGRFIGGLRIHGTINDAPAVVRDLGADAVVVACKCSPARLRVVREVLRPTGVSVSLFSLSETTLDDASAPPAETKRQQ